MIYRVEAWSVPGEDSNKEDMEEVETFDDIDEAMRWAWERMEEGYQTRMYRDGNRANDNP